MPPHPPEGPRRTSTTSTLVPRHPRQRAASPPTRIAAPCAPPARPHAAHTRESSIAEGVPRGAGVAGHGSIARPRAWPRTCPSIGALARSQRRETNSRSGHDRVAPSSWTHRSLASGRWRCRESPISRGSLRRCKPEPATPGVEIAAGRRRRLIRRMMFGAAPANRRQQPERGPVDDRAQRHTMVRADDDPCELVRQPPTWVEPMLAVEFQAAVAVAQPSRPQSAGGHAHQRDPALVHLRNGRSWGAGCSGIESRFAMRRRRGVRPPTGPSGTAVTTAFLTWRTRPGAPARGRPPSPRCRPARRSSPAWRA